MITKEDCLSILVRLGDSGINTDKEIARTAASKEIPFDFKIYLCSSRDLLK